MSKQPVTSKHAPAAIGPYSQGIRAGNTVYLSGQIGLDPATGQLVEGLEAQAHQVIRNLRAVAQALQQIGFRRVRPLLGGIDAWIAAGHDVERST